MTVDERERRLRELLVRGAREVSVPRARWKVGAFVAGVAIVSGATGALSAAALSQDSSFDESVAASAVLSVVRPNSTLVGVPYFQDVTGEVSINVGPMPEGATGISIVTHCQTAGTVTMSIDGAAVGSNSCDANSKGNAGGLFPVSGGGSHSISLVASPGAKFGVSAGWVKEPPKPTAAGPQKLEMADGVVTRDEYLAAFNRFVGCMSGAGYDILNPQATNVVITYSITDEAKTSGAYERCYLTQFAEVDYTWQIQNEGS